MTYAGHLVWVYRNPKVGWEVFEFRGHPIPRKWVSVIGEPLAYQMIKLVTEQEQARANPGS